MVIKHLDCNGFVTSAANQVTKIAHVHCDINMYSLSVSLVLGGSDAVPYWRSYRVGPH